MSKPIIRIHDVTTNEIIDREMTDSEFEVYQAQQAIDAAEAAALAEAQANKEATKQAAQAKLAALGLTVDDLAALGL
jgi:hypothetical protein